MNIRTATPQDAAAILAIYAPYIEQTAITFEYDVPSVEEFRGRIESTLKHYPYLVCEEEGEIVGYAYAGVFKARAAYSHCVETSIYVKMGQHGKGIGKKLYERLEEELKKMGILNLKTGHMNAANAGHAYPILSMPGESFEVLKDKHSFVLGGISDIQYKEYELQLKPGSRLFLYTDGVPEATNAADEMFGVQRTLEALNSVPDGTPRQLLERVETAVREVVQGAPQFDDLTMLCIEYIGQE